MTTRPHLKLGDHLLPGVVAVALFAVLAYVSWVAPFTGREGFPRGFPGGESITENIGYLMFNLNDLANVAGEGFLVPFEVVDVVLVAALVAAVMLARRDEGGEVTTALPTEPDEGTGESSTTAAGSDDGRPRTEPDGGRPAVGDPDGDATAKESDDPTGGDPDATGGGDR